MKPEKARSQEGDQITKELNISHQLKVAYQLIDERKALTRQKLETEEILTKAGGTEEARIVAKKALEQVDAALLSTADNLKEVSEWLLMQKISPHHLSKLAASLDNPDLSTWLKPPSPEPDPEKVTKYWPGSPTSRS